VHRPVQLLILVSPYEFDVMPASKLELTDFSRRLNRVGEDQGRETLSLQMILPIEIATFNLQVIGVKIARRLNNFAGTDLDRQSGILSAPSRHLARCNDSERQRLRVSTGVLRSKQKVLDNCKGHLHVYTAIDHVRYLPSLR
jgi:hypothetical protein